MFGVCCRGCWWWSELAFLCFGLPPGRLYCWFYCNVTVMRTDVCPICEQPFTADRRAVPGDVIVRESEKHSWRGRKSQRISAAVCVECMGQRCQRPDLGDWSGVIGVEMPQFVDGYVPVECENCGTPCLVRPNKKRVRAYCSTRCRAKLLTPTVPGTVTECATCGAEVVGRKGRRYCSNACRQKAYRRR